MSRYIGKRVFYQCAKCFTNFTLSKKSVDDSLNSDKVFCSSKCFDAHREHQPMLEVEQVLCEDCGGLGQIKIDFCAYGEDGKPLPPIPCPAWKWVDCEACDRTGVAA